MKKEQIRTIAKRVGFAVLTIFLVSLAAMIIYSFFFKGTYDDSYPEFARRQAIIFSAFMSAAFLTLILRNHASDSDARREVKDAVKEQRETFSSRDFFIRFMKTEGWLYALPFALFQLPLCILYAVFLPISSLLAPPVVSFPHLFSVYYLFYEITQSALLGFLLNTVTYCAVFYTGVYIIQKKWSRSDL